MTGQKILCTGSTCRVPCHCEFSCLSASETIEQRTCHTVNSWRFICTLRCFWSFIEQTNILVQCSHMWFFSFEVFSFVTVFYKIHPHKIFFLRWANHLRCASCRSFSEGRGVPGGGIEPGTAIQLSDRLSLSHAPPLYPCAMMTCVFKELYLSSNFLQWKQL
jgi:hypothetical protein